MAKIQKGKSDNKEDRGQQYEKRKPIKKNDCHSADRDASDDDSVDFGNPSKDASKHSYASEGGCSDSYPSVCIATVS